MFLQHNLQAWFQHIEGQFQFRGITQDVTKYFYMAAVVKASTTIRAMGLLESPSEAGKFDTFKVFLIRLFSVRVGEMRTTFCLTVVSAVLNSHGLIMF